MSTPPFILELRKKIGHDLLWLHGVTACVLDEHGRILLGRRADTGEWAMVYGIIDPGEQPADAAVREVKEETGVDVVVTDLVSVNSEQRILTYANGDHAQPDVLLPIFAMRRTPAKQHDTRAHGKQRHRCQPRNGYTGIGDERLGIGAIAVLRNTSRTGAARFGSSRRLPPDFHCLPREWSSHCHRDWEFHHRPVSWSRPAY